MSVLALKQKQRHANRSWPSESVLALWKRVGGKGGEVVLSHAVLTMSLKPWPNGVHLMSATPARCCRTTRPMSSRHPVQPTTLATKCATPLEVARRIVQEEMEEAERRGAEAQVNQSADSPAGISATQRTQERGRRPIRQQEQAPLSSASEQQCAAAMASCPPSSARGMSACSIQLEGRCE